MVSHGGVLVSDIDQGSQTRGPRTSDDGVARLVRYKRIKHRVSGLALKARMSGQTGGLGSRSLSDKRERPRRGIPPDPLPDGESGEVQEGEHPPGVSGFRFFFRSKFGFDFFYGWQAPFEFVGQLHQVRKFGDTHGSRCAAKRVFNNDLGL